MTFQQYVAFMQKRLADTATQEEITKSFRVLAGDRVRSRDLLLHLRSISVFYFRDGIKEQLR